MGRTLHADCLFAALHNRRLVTRPLCDLLLLMEVVRIPREWAGNMQFCGTQAPHCCRLPLWNGLFC